MTVRTDSSARRLPLVAAKTALAALALAVALSALLTALALSHYADHECSGEDCPVCALMTALTCSTSNSQSSAPPAPSHQAIALLPLLVLAACVRLTRAGGSLVSLKVRLDI